MPQPKRWRTTATTQERARELRRAQTPAEQRLWSRLRSKQLYGLKFRRQHPVGRFVVDFCCISRKLVIEIDGDSHASQEAYDQARTAWLEEQGYRVVRFTNREVTYNLDAVLEAIAQECRVDV
jgi:very-short-patch-repair endonuclease